MTTVTHYMTTIYFLNALDECRKDEIKSETLEEAQQFVEVGLQRGYFRRALHHGCFEYILVHRILKIEIDTWQETV